MTQLILNFQNDLEPAGGMKTSSSLAGSHNYVSHTQQQESDSARKMRDTSGRKCLEQLERLNHVGSWAKTFTALLIGQEGWYSTRCKLTWKLKGTKYNRIYCQLYPSTLPIEETGFGLLLKTPTTMDGEVSSGKKNPVSGNSGTLAQKIMSGYQPTMMKLGLLPTPTTQEPTSECEVNENGRRVTASGDSHSLNLGRLAGMGMLPTPRANQVNGCDLNSENLANRNKWNLEESVAKWVVNQMLPTPMASEGTKMSGGETENQMSLSKLVREATGLTSQLSPQFVLEMMGFPTDWTELPFLSGETKA